MFNLHFKQFKSLENSNNGEVSESTTFIYYQDDNQIWGEYEGGDIKSGRLTGQKTTENGFEFSYAHENIHGKTKTGTCKTQVSFSRTGKIILNETWEWTCDDYSQGHSVLIEQ